MLRRYLAIGALALLTAVSATALLKASSATASPNAGPTKENPQKIAVFDFDLIDDSQEGEINGPRSDETQRLVLISEELRRLLKADGRFEPVDLTPVKADIERLRPIYKCNGCEDALAKKLGVDFVMVGTVQKVSNLILNLNLFIRDVKAGKIIRGMSSDIRSNSDDSWMHGVKYVVKNQLLADKQPGQQ